MFNWNKKENPFASFGGFGGGGLALVGGSGAVPATPFTAKIVLVGGGGGGGVGQGAGAGAAGGVGFFDYPITIGTSYDLRVGSGGRGGSPIGGGLDGEYSMWAGQTDYLVGEGGQGGPPGSNGGNGNEQGGSGGGGGTSGSGGSGSPVPGPRSPYIFGGRNGAQGTGQSGGSGGNQGGGGGGATVNGSNSDGPGTPGQVGGGNGGAGKTVPSVYLPDTFTQTDTGPSPNQFLGMLITNPGVLRRTFAGGGGGGSEHGNWNLATGGDGGGGHGGWGSPGIPAQNNTNYPPAGSAGQTFGPNVRCTHGEPGYEGRGGGGGGGGYQGPDSHGGGGGAGICIIQSPVNAAITVGSIPSPRVTTYTSGDYYYHVILGNNGTAPATGTVLTGTVEFGNNE